MCPVLCLLYSWLWQTYTKIENCLERKIMEKVNHMSYAQLIFFAICLKCVNQGLTLSTASVVYYFQGLIVDCLQLHFAFLPLLHWGVLLQSLAKFGVDPSQQTRSDLEHFLFPPARLLLLLPPPCLCWPSCPPRCSSRLQLPRCRIWPRPLLPRLAGGWPSGQMAGLPARPLPWPGHGAVPLSMSLTGALPSAQVGADPSEQTLTPRA